MGFACDENRSSRSRGDGKLRTAMLRVKRTSWDLNQDEHGRV